MVLIVNIPDNADLNTLQTISQVTSNLGEKMYIVHDEYALLPRRNFEEIIRVSTGLKHIFSEQQILEMIDKSGIDEMAVAMMKEQLEEVKNGD